MKNITRKLIDITLEKEIPLNKVFDTYNRFSQRLFKREVTKIDLYSKELKELSVNCETKAYELTKRYYDLQTKNSSS